VSTTTLFITVILLSISSYWFATRKARAVSSGKLSDLHSRLPYYGYMTVLWSGLPALIVLLVWVLFESTIVSGIVMSELPPELAALSEAEKSLVLNDIQNLAQGLQSSKTDEILLALSERYTSLIHISRAASFVVVLCILIAGGLLALKKITPALRARNRVESIIRGLLIFCSTIAIFTTVGIVLSVLFESLRFFEKVPPVDFFFGLDWSPQMAIRADQVGSSGAFGMIPVFAGTMLISLIAMMVAVPVGLLSAI
jgi:phosphate transport system permease protein